MAHRLTREALYELIWSEPVRTVAAQFGVSDVALAKACRRANVPLPPRGYWAQVRAGHVVERPALPATETGQRSSITIGIMQRSASPARTDSLKAEPHAAPSAVRVPERLNHPHALVAATRTRAQAARPADDGRLHLRAEAGAFELRVSRAALGRALLILQAICEESERRGWQMVAHHHERYRQSMGGLVQIGRHAYPVALEEQTEAEPYTEREIEKWRASRSRWETRDEPPPQSRRRHPTGRLTLVLPQAWEGRGRWADGKQQRIEAKLGDFFAALVQSAARDEKRHERAEREQQEREDRERIARATKARGDRLVTEVSAWQEARLMRAYARRLRSQAQAWPADQERLAAWCDWVEQRADQVDPTRNPRLVAGFEEPDGR